jgi:hypothetical protein
MSTVEGSFLVEAWVTGKRWTHHRTRDHHGFESDLDVALSSAVGPYPEGATVHSVLLDMLSRIALLESAETVRDDFSVDAVIWSGFGPLPDGSTSPVYGHFFADAVVLGTGSGDFTVDAVITRGGSFTVDAVIIRGGSFTVRALIA